MEEELKILKNEMQTVLLDIREQYLNLQNPFNTVALLEAKEQAAAAIEELKQAKDQVDKSAPPAEQSALKPEPPKNAVASSMPNIPLSPIPEAQTAHTIPVNNGMPYVAPQSGATNNSHTSSSPDCCGIPGLPPGNLATDDMDSVLETSKSSQDPTQRKEDKGKHLSRESSVRPEPEDSQQAKLSRSFGGDSKYGLIIVAGLAQWVETATGKLGKERVEALVEVSNSMGRLPDNFKDLIVRLARLSTAEHTPELKVTARDYLLLLTQLEDLVGETQPHERALLSILSNSGGSVWTR
jgi:hypothetical protein